MKYASKLLPLLFVAFLLSKSYTGKAQTLNPNDTICPTVKVYQNLLIGAQQSVALRVDIKDLKERAATLEGVINRLQERDSATVVGYEKRIAELYLQKGIYETEISRLEKENRKLRRKVRWTAIAGVLSTAGAFFIGMGGLK